MTSDISSRRWCGWLPPTVAPPMVVVTSEKKEVLDCKGRGGVRKCLERGHNTFFTLEYPN